MLTLTERFWAKVRKTEGCWLWTGARGSNHTRRPWYGQLWRDGRAEVTHRVSWELHYGPIPTGSRVLHHCDEPACVRPDHLFLGTQSDNMKDCYAKGRHAVIRVRAARTHCPSGHPFDDENTRWYRGWRHCRACKREQRRAARQVIEEVV